MQTDVRLFASYLQSCQLLQITTDLQMAAPIKSWLSITCLFSPNFRILLFYNFWMNLYPSQRAKAYFGQKSIIQNKVFKELVSAVLALLKFYITTPFWYFGVNFNFI